MDYSAIDAALREAGLIARGGFLPTHGDKVPSLDDGSPARGLVLVGNVGAAMWRAFAQTPEVVDGRPDPLNRWSARVIGALAARCSAKALFPFGGPPHHPFVAWAKRADAVAESPLRMLIHPDYGLWHAYRGALAFATPISLPPRDARPRPCDTCPDKPCLSTCPVGAFAGGAYDVPACVHHIASPAGVDCMDLGCRARRACPVGRDYAYQTAQARFHMEAFLRARQGNAVKP